MLHEVTTPSGLWVQYEDGLPGEDGKTHRRNYWVNGTRVPSVTTALGVLDKPGIKYAAERLTVEGMLQLESKAMSVEGCIETLKQEELRFYQVWGKTGDRGTEVHDVLTRILSGRTDLGGVSGDALPFAEALVEWAARETPEVEQSEVMVGSAMHGFAGRFDLLCRLPLVHWDHLIRLDLKTQQQPLKRKRDGTAYPPYESHLLQLAGYEIAARESGYPASSYQAILRVDCEGDTDLFVTQVPPATFLAVLDAYNALQEAKALERMDPVEQLIT